MVVLSAIADKSFETSDDKVKMEKIVNRARQAVIFIIFAVMSATSSFASSDAGIELIVNKFKICIYHSVAADYKNNLEKHITDPDKLLFQLIGIIQKNKESFMKAEGVLYVELFANNEETDVFIAVYEGKLIEGVLDLNINKPIYKNIVENDYSDVIIDALGYMTGGLYTEQKIKYIDIYNCNESGSVFGISFGSFPSESVNKIYSIFKAPGCKCKKIRVAKGRMKEYFRQL